MTKGSILLGKLYSCWSTHVGQRLNTPINPEAIRTSTDFVNRLYFRQKSARIDPSWYLSSVIVRRSFSSCNASSAAVGCRGSNGGAIGSSSKTRFFRLIPSGNWFGGLRTSFSSSSKNARLFSAFGLENCTRFSLVSPNHARTSRGSCVKRPSTTASRRTGSLGDIEPSMERTVARAVSDTAALHPFSEGIYTMDRWCRLASTNSWTIAASGV